MIQKKISSQKKTAEDGMGGAAGEVCELRITRTCDPGHSRMTLENTEVSRMERTDSQGGRTSLGRIRTE